MAPRESLEERINRLERDGALRERRLSEVEQSMREIAADLKPVLTQYRDDKMQEARRRRTWRVTVTAIGLVLGIPVFISSILSLVHGVHL